MSKRINRFRSMNCKRPRFLGKLIELNSPVSSGRLNRLGFSIGSSSGRLSDFATTPKGSFGPRTPVPVAPQRVALAGMITFRALIPGSANRRPRYTSSLNCGSSVRRRKMHKFFKMFLTVDYGPTYIRDLWNRYHYFTVSIPFAKQIRPDRIHAAV